jgi:hypothetical protein
MSDNYQHNSAFNAAATAKIYHAHLEDISKFTPDKFNHLKRGGIREGAGRNFAEINARNARQNTSFSTCGNR